MLYARVNAFIPMLRKETSDFTIDEKARTVLLTEEGVARMEQVLKIDNLYDTANITFQHHVLQALKAHHIFQRDVDYVVTDGQVVIVDEFTGRLMPGRRYSDGLHQALEAKEAVQVEAENQTLATITFQNYFRMYAKLAGMTGTADTEAVEFREIYNLEVISIPTHRPMIRKDFPDLVYKSLREKFEAIANDVMELHKRGQPVLVGTVSIEKSELLSEMLKKSGVPHDVLNAKNHEKEAEIVALAGHAGRVTIATNMAGRGTDIVLGPRVTDLGGLHILGTERHESRRIDNQLRGRSGRQGDPGSSRFYLALDDDLMRLFGSDRLKGLMDKLGMEDGEPIENRMVSRAIENAQKRVEAHNFEIRKQLLEYDNVMNQQREVIYSRRRELMATTEPESFVMDYHSRTSWTRSSPPGRGQGPSRRRKAWSWPRPRSRTCSTSRSTSPRATKPKRRPCSRRPKPVSRIWPTRPATTTGKSPATSCSTPWTGTGRNTCCPWTTCATASAFAATARKDPKQEYKREGFELFQQLIYSIRDAAIRALSRVRIKAEVQEQEFQHKDETANLQYSGSAPAEDPKKAPTRRGRPQGRPQRSLPLRQRQEIQEVLRREIKPGRPPLPGGPVFSKAGAENAAGVFSSQCPGGGNARLPVIPGRPARAPHGGSCSSSSASWWSLAASSGDFSSKAAIWACCFNPSNCSSSAGRPWGPFSSPRPSPSPSARSSTSCTCSRARNRRRRTTRICSPCCSN